MVIDLFWPVVVVIIIFIIIIIIITIVVVVVVVVVVLVNDVVSSYVDKVITTTLPSKRRTGKVECLVNLSSYIRRNVSYCNRLPFLCVITMIFCA